MRANWHCTTPQCLYNKTHGRVCYRFHCLYMWYVWFVLSKFVVDVVPYPALFSCLAGFFLPQELQLAGVGSIIAVLVGFLCCFFCSTKSYKPLPVLAVRGFFSSQIIGYAAIYYITPHKTHVKGDFSAFRCTGRVNVQGQTIGTKKGTKSPQILPIPGIALAGFTPIVRPWHRLCPYRWCFLSSSGLHWVAGSGFSAPLIWVGCRKYV
jgi:hypothetical protein